METYLVRFGEREYNVDVGADGAISVEGHKCLIDVHAVGNAAYSVIIDGISTLVVTRGNSGAYEFLLRGKYIEGRVETARDRLLRQYESTITTSGRRLEVRAPMPALVLKIEVKIGDELAPGQGLLILEAMKMENEIKAHQAGTVKEIYVSEGKPVEKGELLILLE